MAGGGAGDGDAGAERVDAPREGALRHHLPLAVDLADLDDGAAVGGELRVHHLARQAVGEAREHERRVGVLVVHAQQPVLAVRRAERQRDVADEVVVVAELPALRGGIRVGGVESGRPRQQRVAPADQHLRAVAGRDVVGGVDTAGDLREGEAGRVGAWRARLRRGLGGSGRQRPARQRRQRRGRERTQRTGAEGTAQQLAAADGLTG